MLVTLKTLQQQTFKIEIEPEETVKVLKEKIEKEKGPNVFPANGQKLIYAGKILDDEKTVSSYKIEEKNFVVVMVTKPKAAPPPASDPAPAPVQAQAPVPTPAPEASAPSEAPQTTPSTTETVKTEEDEKMSETASTTTESSAGIATPTESTSATTTEASQSTASMASNMSSTSAESALVTGEDYEVIVNRIVNMGFTKEDVQRALRASFNNPDRAVEYLCGGIPDVPADPPQEPVPESRPTGEQSTPQQRQPPSTPAQAPAAPQQQSPAQTPAPAPAPAPAQSQAQQPSVPSAGSGSSEDTLAFLRSQPQFQHMRTLIQSRPELLPELLQQIGQANPQLLQMISENQEQFIGMLNEQGEGDVAQGGGGSSSGGGGGGAPGGGPGMGGGYIQITQQEKEAIERLKALGFSEGECIQAYFACDKNEQLAANFLLSHGDDDES